MWAGLDKALPVVYGLGFIFAVVRVLPASEFGLLVLFQSVFFFVQMVDTTMVHVPLAKFLAEGEGAEWAIPTAFLLSFLLLSIFALAGFGGAALIATLMRTPDLQRLLGLMPFLLIAFYWKNLASQICIARHAIRHLFFIDAVYFLGSLLLLMLWQRFSALADARQVIWINVIAAAGSSLSAGILTRKVLYRAGWKLHGQRVRQFWSFGKYSFGAGLANSFYAQLDAILIGYFYGPVQVAIYSAGKIIFRFYNLVSQAAQVVLLPLVSRFHALHQREEIRVLAEKSICFLFLALLPFHLLLFAGSEALLEILYHGKYSGAAPLLRWLAVGALVLPWGVVGSILQLGLGEPKINFRFAWMVTLFNAFANWVLLPQLGILGAAIAMALSLLLAAVIQARQMHKTVQLSLAGIWRRRGDPLNFARIIWAKLDAMSRPMIF